MLYKPTAKENGTELDFTAYILEGQKPLEQLAVL